MTGDYQVIARNPAGDSENRIHADDVARGHGFRGGLVPGVTIYGYTVRAIVDAFGEEWIATGRAHIRFRSPCYDGDHLTIRTGPERPSERGTGPERPSERGTGPGGNGAELEVEVVVGTTTCVTGSASLGEGAPAVAVDWQALAADPEVEPPERHARPVASQDSFQPGTILGSIEWPTDRSSADSYLRRIAESSEIYSAKGWVHPGLLLEAANRVLTANVVMPLWLHVETDVQHVRFVPVGEAVVVRGRIADEWERRGRRFVAVDVGWFAGAELIAAAHHVAIWRLGGT